MTDNFPPIEELIKRISSETGLAFAKQPPHKWLDYDGAYLAKDRGAEYEVFYDTYMDTDTRFINVGYGYKTSGGGAPCDSVDEAVNRIKRYMETVAKERERLKPKKKERYVQLSLFDWEVAG